MSWTDERVEILKKLWGEGQSASQIAKELGGVTRNAVIGKVHRLGLSNRATSSSSKSDAKPNKKQGIAIKAGWYQPKKLGSSNALVAMIEIKPPVCDILSIPIR